MSAVTRFVLLVVCGLLLFDCFPSKQSEGAAGTSKCDGSAPAEPGKIAQPAQGSGDRFAEPIKRVVEIRAGALKGGPSVLVARYETRYRDPVLEELRRRDKASKEERAKKTGQVRERQEQKKETGRLEEKVLQSALPAAERPASPDEFEQVPHLPPVAQYRTGTCWSFAATSFFESEVQRITGQRVKLSEMATVYHEYLAKASRFIRERGDSLFVEGSEANAATRVLKQRGVWPREVFSGFVGDDERHDHQRMFREMDKLLQSFKRGDMWDEASGLSMLQVILDRHLGRPPEHFENDGRRLTSVEYLREVLRLNPDDYVQFMSTLKVPFYTWGEFEVPDNWWRDESYHNVPLEEFCAALDGAIQKGYSLVIAVDVTEPGKDAENDALFVPDYDIPQDRIDQLARELRLANKATTDDHGVHLVGHKKHAGRDWYLVKDSGRSARRGKHKGYFFLRDDYVRLKVLAYTVHKDAVADLLARFEGT